MDLTTENIYMLGICFLAILFLFFIGSLKFIFKILMRTTFSLTIIYFVNILLCLAPDLKKFCIGINFISAIVSILLGFPGIISLYILQSIL